MRLVVQRVSQAQLFINQELYSEIDKGLVVFVAVEKEDGKDDLDWILKKLLGLRIFSDEKGQMNLSIQDVKGELMLVSQFTLFGSLRKGSRPSFIRSAGPDVAIPLYESLIENCKSKLTEKVVTGKFGADMKVSLENDGPVTILLDSKNKNI